MNNKYTESTFKNFENNNFIATPIIVICSLLLLFVNTTRSLIALGLMAPLGLANAQLLYYAISLVVMMFSLFALYSQHKLICPSNIRKLFYINLVIYIAWLVPEVVVGKSNIAHFIYFALVPFSIFIFMQIPSKLLKKLILLLALIASIITIYDFILANNPLTNTFRENLRIAIDPGVLDQTHVGIFIRAVGITGSEHDTACMLVMMSTYILAMKQNEINEYFRVLLLYCCYLALFLTLSMANIIAMIVVTMFFFFHDSLKKKFFNPTLIGIPVLIFLFALTQVSFQGDATSGERIGPTNLIEAVAAKGTAEGVMDKFLMREMGYTDTGDKEFDLKVELAGIFLGHDSNSKYTWGKKLEFGIITIVYTSGIVGYISTIAILFLPLFLYINSNRFTKDQMFPFLVPLLAGILTLWHYGSVVRAPNIFLFFAIYGACIRQYMLSGYFKRHMNNKISATN